MRIMRITASTQGTHRKTGIGPGDGGGEHLKQSWGSFWGRNEMKTDVPFHTLIYESGPSPCSGCGSKCPQERKACSSRQVQMLLLRALRGQADSCGGRGRTGFPVSGCRPVCVSLPGLSLQLKDLDLVF